MMNRTVTGEILELAGLMVGYCNKGRTWNRHN
jgi:hypothetical protein